MFCFVCFFLNVTDLHVTEMSFIKGIVCVFVLVFALVHVPEIPVHSLS